MSAKTSSNANGSPPLPCGWQSKLILARVAATVMVTMGTSLYSEEPIRLQTTSGMNLEHVKTRELRYEEQEEPVNY